MGDGKRFRAYQIVKSLKEKGKEEILRRLRKAVEAKDKQDLKALLLENASKAFPGFFRKNINLLY